MGEQYYVYAIVASDTHLPEGVAGFGSPPHILCCRELGAVVSHMSVAGMDDVRQAATTENLLRHEQVVEAVCSRGPALPVRFSTVLPNEEAVTHALATRYDTLRADLRRIGDKIEMGITVLWPSPEAQSSTPNRSAEVGGRADDGAVSADRRAGLAYLRSRRVEYRKAESAREHAQALARDLDAVLRPHALDCHRGLCPSERLALRDLYLMERKQVSAFEKAFDEVQRRHMEVRFLLSGPWPPYSFVTSLAQHATQA
jgi:Gas vesicle synthesis protein GvpL/GvpF